MIKYNSSFFLSFTYYVFQVKYILYIWCINVFIFQYLFSDPSVGTAVVLSIQGILVIFQIYIIIRSHIWYHLMSQVNMYHLYKVSLVIFQICIIIRSHNLVPSYVPGKYVPSIQGILVIFKICIIIRSNIWYHLITQVNMYHLYKAF